MSLPLAPHTTSTLPSHLEVVAQEFDSIIRGHGLLDSGAALREKLINIVKPSNANVSMNFFH